MHWLDILTLVILALGILRGLRLGLIKSVIQILAGIVSFTQSWRLASWVRADILPLLDIAPEGNRWLVFVISFIILYSLIYLALSMLTSILRVGPLKLIDHLLGGVAGLVITIYALGYLFMLVDSALPYQRPDEGELATGLRSTSLFYEPIRNSIVDLEYITDYLNNNNITKTE